MPILPALTIRFTRNTRIFEIKLPSKILHKIHMGIQSCIFYARLFNANFTLNSTAVLRWHEKNYFSIAWPRKKFARERKGIAFPRNLCVPSQTFCVGTQYFARPRRLCVAAQRLKMTAKERKDCEGTQNFCVPSQSFCVPSQSFCVPSQHLEKR